MDPNRVLAYGRLAETHWWLTGKYVVLADLVRAQVPRGADLSPMLDVGCAGGAFLRRAGGLASHRFGVDRSTETLRACNGVGVAGGDAVQLPFAQGVFSLVSAIDVLEHLEDDGQAVDELGRVMRPGGWLLLCVPAFPALSGRHDELFGHLRRYTRGPLCRLVEAAGFSVRKATYIEPLFFLPLWVKRRFLPVKDPLMGDLTEPRPWVNRLLHRALAAERFPLRYMSFPIGATLIVVAQKGT